jgi:hypothetical protein
VAPERYAKVEEALAHPSPLTSPFHGLIKLVGSHANFALTAVFLLALSREVRTKTEPGRKPDKGCIEALRIRPETLERSMPRLRYPSRSCDVFARSRPKTQPEELLRSRWVVQAIAIEGGSCATASGTT